MRSITVNIKRPYLIQGFTYRSLEHFSNLYINCTILKFLLHITNIVWSVLIQAASLYTYNNG